MLERTLDWLVGRWEWPNAVLVTAVTITLLLPVWYADAGLLTVLVVLQLPLYMFHQYEEHHGNRFVTYFNRVVGDGYEVLTPMSAFVINSIGVWGVIFAGIVLYRFAAPGYGTVATDLALVNVLGHVQLAVRRREYNPGLWTALLLFIPFGGAGLYAVTTLGHATLAQEALGAVVAIAIHAAIIVYGNRRKFALANMAAAPAAGFTPAVREQ